MSSDEKLIDEFWSWFSDVAVQLSDQNTDQHLIRELDERIRRLNPKLSWELGPGISEPSQLVISPNLEAALRPVASLVVSRAPDLAGWEFHATRQPKNWNYTFELERERGGATCIDASKWRFVLLRYPDKRHEILLVGNNLASLTDDERWQAAAIALESILGEEILLDRIEHFELVERVDAQFAGTERPIQSLLEAVGRT